MRRNRAKVREIIPDAKYHDVLVARFINCLMSKGKKSVVEKEVYKAFDTIKAKLDTDPVIIFKDVVERVTPKIEVRSKRVGGATYQVPCEVSERRGSALALKWLKTAIRQIAGKKLSEKIYKVIMDTLNNTGWAYKKKEDVFRMAEANKAFAHFNW
jgi:small subunit ribosomal protein S7